VFVSVHLSLFFADCLPFFSPFTKILAKFYASIVQQKGADAISVVFVSSDSDETAMFEYFMEEHGDWLTIPYVKRDLKNQLSEQYKISGIPTCVILNGKMEEVSNTPFIDNATVRSLLQSLPANEGPNFDSIAIQIYEKMRTAVAKSLSAKGGNIGGLANASSGGKGDTAHAVAAGNKGLTIDKDNVDIFCSLRFVEASKEAHLIQDALKEYKINAVIIDDVENGDDICGQVAELLDAAKMVIIFGTETYGKGTEASFSTKEELSFIMAEKKPFFLLKMCERFLESRTRFHLPNSIAYMKWTPGTELAKDIVEAIVSKFHKLTSGQK
jgi:hypothetical protein